MTCAHSEHSSALPSDGASEAHPLFLAKSPSILAETEAPTRARDNGIRDKDIRRSVRTLYDGIDVPYLLEELLVRYDARFARTPKNERCVFCNATYLGETTVKLRPLDYSLANHIWLVDFYRANNRDFSHPVEGLLMVWTKKWRNVGAPAPARAFEGLCAVTADRRRNIIAIEASVEARL